MKDRLVARAKNAATRNTPQAKGFAVAIRKILARRFQEASIATRVVDTIGETSIDGTAKSELQKKDGTGANQYFTANFVGQFKARENCLVSIHGLVLNVTDWITSHPGGPDKFNCGHDLTAPFQAQHGLKQQLLDKIAKHSAKVQLMGKKVNPPPVAFAKVPSGPKADYQNLLKVAHPGSGAEFKTLVRDPVSSSCPRCCRDDPVVLSHHA